MMKIEDIQCSKCGCRGIHACIGYRSQPMTEDKKLELIEAIKKVWKLRDEDNK